MILDQIDCQSVQLYKIGVTRLVYWFYISAARRLVDSPISDFPRLVSPETTRLPDVLGKPYSCK